MTKMPYSKYFIATHSQLVYGKLVETCRPYPCDYTSCCYLNISNYSMLIPIFNLPQICSMIHKIQSKLTNKWYLVPGIKAYVPWNITYPPEPNYDAIEGLSNVPHFACYPPVAHCHPHSKKHPRLIKT